MFGLPSFLSDVGGVLSTLGKVNCVEAYHSPASNIEVASVCKFTSDIPSCASASSLIERDNFRLTFTFTFQEKEGHCGITFIFLRLFLN